MWWGGSEGPKDPGRRDLTGTLHSILPVRNCSLLARRTGVQVYPVRSQQPDRYRGKTAKNSDRRTRLKRWLVPSCPTIESLVQGLFSAENAGRRKNDKNMLNFGGLASLIPVNPCLRSREPGSRVNYQGEKSTPEYPTHMEDDRAPPAPGR